MAMIAAAAIAAGILPQARLQRAPNKKRIGCYLAEDVFFCDPFVRGQSSSASCRI